MLICLRLLKRALLFPVLTGSIHGIDGSQKLLIKNLEETLNDDNGNNDNNDDDDIDHQMVANS